MAHLGDLGQSDGWALAEPLDLTDAGGTLLIDPQGAADGTGLMAHRAYADASKVSKIAGSTHRTCARLQELRIQQLIEPNDHRRRLSRIHGYGSNPMDGLILVSRGQTIDDAPFP